MLELNLLPPQEKKEAELANLTRLVTSLSIWFLAFLIIFTLLLASTFFYLSILLRAQNRLIEIRQSDPKAQRLVEIEKKIKQANSRLSQIHLKQKDLILWVPLLEEMAELTPGRIYLTSFSYQLAENQIYLSGWANTRDNLLTFQDSLEESPFFVEVEAPLSNLLKKSDIDFNFTLHLK